MAEAGSVVGPGVLAREGGVEDRVGGTRDGAAPSEGKRGDSHTSQVAIEWWLRKVQTGQAIRDPVSFGSKSCGAGDVNTAGRVEFEEKLDGLREGGEGCRAGVPRLDGGREEVDGRGSRATPQREHFSPSSTEGTLRIPQIRQTQARSPAAAASASRSRFLSRAVAATVSVTASEGAGAGSDRTRVIFG